MASSGSATWPQRRFSPQHAVSWHGSASQLCELRVRRHKDGGDWTSPVFPRAHRSLGLFSHSFLPLHSFPFLPLFLPPAHAKREAADAKAAKAAAAANVSRAAANLEASAVGNTPRPPALNVTEVAGSAAVTPAQVRDDFLRTLKHTCCRVCVCALQHASPEACAMVFTTPPCSTPPAAF